MLYSNTLTSIPSPDITKKDLEIRSLCLPSCLASLYRKEKNYLVNAVQGSLIKKNSKTGASIIPLTILSSFKLSVTLMTSGGRKVEVGRAVPDYKYVRHKPESELLTSQAEYS